MISHVTKVDIEIRDLDAMKAACEKRGLQLRRDQKTYRWWGHSVGDYPIPAGMTAADLGKCSHAIHLNDASYEIGLVAQTDGSYRMVYDFYGQANLLAAVGGQKCDGLVGDYTIEAARNAAMAQGWMTQDNSDSTLTIFHPDGGSMTVNRDGTVDSNGFIGSGCSVAGIIENAIGKPRETAYKPEYFADRAKIRQS
ncbi:MAG: hypothetical protein HY422_02470 [Candidatus Komeilibacteria bacterium]|nr:hypothetical protein [Candidatus Komeilibacteria bacterium]